MTRQEYDLMTTGVDNKDGEYIQGYLVVYPDGYKSWSPKRVFEESYRMVSDKEKELIIR